MGLITLNGFKEFLNILQFINVNHKCESNNSQGIYKIVKNADKSDFPICHDILGPNQ